MKKTVLLSGITLLLLLFACRRKGDENLKNGGLTKEMLRDSTKVVFSQIEYDFDTIQEGQIVEHYFTFKNIGDKNLYIANAYGSCGCTVPEYPKEPVTPGSEGRIKVTFNSAGKEGPQNKTITLIMNTANRNELLYMKGFVRKKGS
ncbi:MAG: DUF1573 domain-containing protein [Chitinophagales bacterium]|nr:DUF1573 domain-containing protein [Chitinophagales bacterium]MDW8273885.1 DUF1573 domain-containing protein [Chitinophagales bacterium]